MTTSARQLILDAARRRRTERTPVWLMRQAGRADPEYCRLRQRCGLPLEELFCSPDLAAEITLQPRKLGVDALILFQDILTPLAPMGARFLYRPGPVLEDSARPEAVACRLRDIEPAEDLAFVAESIRLVRQEVSDDVPLLGFAGAPLTLAAFLLEGGSPGELHNTRKLMRDEPGRLHDLLDRLARMTSAYLSLQIATGVDAVQLFESIADLLSEQEYGTFAHPYQARAIRDLRATAPVILFVKERPWLDLMIETGADVLSVGTCVDLAEARRRYGDRVAFQGNVDNRLLVDGSPAAITRAVEACVQAGGHEGHILNLSHGLLPETPIDNVRRLVDACHAARLEADSIRLKRA
ncbi:MAG: uroporphyrinogen decarboxylase [Planctomycetota bacterium]|jgi:uroporphyrinogen decarboxylase